MLTRNVGKTKLWKLVLVGISLLCIDGGLPPVGPAGASRHPRSVVILGIDGMDPILLKKFVEKGRMPAFQELMQEGSFSTLGTSIPPQSPVAWSNFITGLDPGGHGIFDYITRDPKNYLPAFSLSHVDEPGRVIKIGGWAIPVSAGKVTLLRKGKAFWQTLDEHKVPYTISRLPSNFPPAPCKGRTLAGLGTPDLVGTYGTFSFFTDDPEFASLDVSGGQIYPITVEDNKFSATLVGPENTLKIDKPKLQAPFSVYTDRESQAAKIVVGKTELLLKVGEWSPWVEVSFNIIGPLHTLKGTCLFYLKSIDPYLRLYVSPINIDPAHPALPLSTPPKFVTEIYKKIGYFYTQGIAEDTKALAWGILDDGEYIHQARIVLDDHLRMLDYYLDQYNGGLLFFYVSTLDLNQHMLWRNMDPKHPAHTLEAAKYQNQLEDFYVDMDNILAHTIERIPRDATLIVMSDHGFSPWYRKVNLNTWLYKNGYLELIDPTAIEKSHFFRNVHWRKTKAYAVGFNGLYVNLRGREGKGTVREGVEYEAFIDELTKNLLSLKDPKTGEFPIHSVYRTSKVYHGDEAKNAPDLIVGYKRGYRCDDESVLGDFTQDVFSDNMDKWSGDHCMAPEEVPGILLSNRKIRLKDPRLSDFAATILALFDIKVSEAPATSRPIF
ncbi:MAG: alkaline phosphatase family protein [Candidatus Eisenbacteria bacterium]|nr:alkaline phosphatase family protein [Candidatus Eisenbacteria bacterium]